VKHVLLGAWMISPAIYRSTVRFGLEEAMAEIRTFYRLSQYALRKAGTCSVSSTDCRKSLLERI